jgi:hypothetical protein
MAWHETHDNLVGLAEWLNSECCAFRDIEDCISFFEKPWKWTREYELWQLWVKADTREPGYRGMPIEMRKFRERCIEAVDDEKMTAERLLAELEEKNAPSP